MDRAPEVLAMLGERAQWEAEQAELAEYEAWYQQRILAEQDAETIAER